MDMWICSICGNDRYGEPTADGVCAGCADKTNESIDATAEEPLVGCEGCGGMGIIVDEYSYELDEYFGDECPECSGAGVLN